MADTMVKLYRYDNGDGRDGGAPHRPNDYTLRLVQVVDAKECPTAYTYRPEGNTVRYSRHYEMVSKTDIGRVPYRGIGSVWMLEDDLDKVRKLLLDKLQGRREKSMRESEREMAECNKAIVALGGYAEWPDYLREEAGG